MWLGCWAIPKEREEEQANGEGAGRVMTRLVHSNERSGEEERKHSVGLGFSWAGDERGGARTC